MVTKTYAIQKNNQLVLEGQSSAGSFEGDSMDSALGRGSPRQHGGLIHQQDQAETRTGQGRKKKLPPSLGQ